MIKTESDMYHDLKKHFHRSLIQRIESGSTGLGIPDLFFRMFECAGWMEMKVLKRFPIYANIKIPFCPGQYNWLKKHYELGGISILLIYIIETKLYYTFKKENILLEYENKQKFLAYASFCNQMRFLRKEDLCCSL